MSTTGLRNFIRDVDMFVLMPYYRSMKREKVLKRVDDALSAFYLEGYGDGWEGGESSGYEEGVSDGIAAYKQMISNRLQLHLDYCMDNNKMSEAKFTKEMTSYLLWEYDPEKAQKDREEEERNSDGYGLIL
jgi:hypothetical protein